MHPFSSGCLGAVHMWMFAGSVPTKEFNHLGCKVCDIYQSLSCQRPLGDECYLGVCRRRSAFLPSPCSWPLRKDRGWRQKQKWLLLLLFFWGLYFFSCNIMQCWCKAKKPNIHTPPNYKLVAVNFILLPVKKNPVISTAAAPTPVTSTVVTPTPATSIAATQTLATGTAATLVPATSTAATQTLTTGCLWKYVFRCCQKLGWNTSEPKSSLSTSTNELEKLERKVVGEGEGVPVSQGEQLREYRDNR